MAKFPSKHLKSQFFNKRILILLVIALFCIVGIVRIGTYHPEIEAETTSPTVTLPGRFSVTFPIQGEAAVGTDDFGVIASSPDQSPVPIASVTKIMTAYLVLKAYPLQPGEEGPTLTMTTQDVSDYIDDLAQGGSVLEVEAGEKLSERQLLEALMLPSADNIATTLARWVSGSENAFVAEMNETAKSLGMMQTHYADTSGLNPASISNAVDQIKIAQVVMKNPVFREIVAMPQANLPVAGIVYNANRMLGEHGIVGIKTGNTMAAGGCFVSAAPIGNGTEPHFILVVVLGQSPTYLPLHSALNANAKILDEVLTEFRLYTLTPPPNGFGQITNAWHCDSTLYSPQPIQILGYPGMNASLSINLMKTQLPIPRGTNMATLRVQSGKSVQDFQLQNSEQINPPGVLWRLFRNSYE